MNSYQTLKVKKQGDIVTVFLHRPNSGNSINMQMVTELSNLMDIVEDSRDVSALVLRGSNDVFCSGIDLNDFSQDNPPDIYGLQKWEKMCRRLEMLKKFTIAAVQGECTGGGFQLLLICDVRIAEKHARLCFNEVKLGFLPGMATFRLAKYIGLGRAKNLILTGRTIKPDEALSLGLLDQVCEQSMFDDLLQETIEKLLPFHPVALEMARRLLTECYATSYENFIGHFLAAQHRAIHSDAFKNLLVKTRSEGQRND